MLCLTLNSETRGFRVWGIVSSTTLSTPRSLGSWHYYGVCSMTCDFWDLSTLANSSNLHVWFCFWRTEDVCSSQTLPEWMAVRARSRAWFMCTLEIWNDFWHFPHFVPTSFFDYKVRRFFAEALNVWTKQAAFVECLFTQFYLFFAWFVPWKLSALTDLAFQTATKTYSLPYHSNCVNTFTWQVDKCMQHRVYCSQLQGVYYIKLSDCSASQR